MSKPSTSKEDATQDLSFFYKPQTIKWILRVFYGICIILLGLDFVIHRHIETSIEEIPTFYAIYGFIACVILVLIANQMRKLLMRDEHYYDDPEKPIKEDDLGGTDV